MKLQGAAIQGGLAVVGLLAAYVTWQRGPEKTEGDVTVLHLNRSDVERVRYDDGVHWVELTPGKAVDDGPKVWIRLGTRPEEPADAGTPTGVVHAELVAHSSGADGGIPDAGVVAARAPVKPPPPPDRELRGNEEAEKAWDAVAPLLATRALGAMDAAKLKELGLADSKRRLEVWGRGAKNGFTVAPTAAGLGSPYLRADGDGVVYVLGNPLVLNLDVASGRLVDRRLHGFRADEVDAVTVQWQGQEKSFVQRSGAPQAPSKLFIQGTDKPDEFAKNWYDKLMRLSAVELLGRGEKPTAGEPSVTLRVRCFAHGRPLGFLELGKVGLDVFGRTEHTAGWVRLPSTSEDLLHEAQKVVSSAS